MPKRVRNSNTDSPGHAMACLRMSKKLRISEIAISATLRRQRHPAASAAEAPHARIQIHQRKKVPQTLFSLRSSRPTRYMIIHVHGRIRSVWLRSRCMRSFLCWDHTHHRWCRLRLKSLARRWMSTANWCRTCLSVCSCWRLWLVRCAPPLLVRPMDDALLYSLAQCSSSSSILAVPSRISSVKCLYYDSSPDFLAVPYFPWGVVRSRTCSNSTSVERRWLCIQLRLCWVRRSAP